MKISITTPTIRPDMMKIVADSLAKQDFDGEWEWLVGSPAHLEEEMKQAIGDVPFRFIPEPPKNKGDFYNLNKCWNSLFRQSKGELIVNIVDGLWFPPDVLSNLWLQFVANPKACITTVGNQYEVVNGRLEVLIWKDPRMRLDQGSFYQVNYPEMELCLASIPKQAIVDCKGIKEKWDEFAALSEKEMCARMEKFGYTLWIDQAIVYKAIYHLRIGGNSEWDKHYFEGCEYMEYCMNQVNQERELLGDL